MSGVLGVLLRRLGAGAIVVWAAATLAFFAVRLVPGSVVDALLGPGTAATPQLRQQIIAEAGLDDPPLVQYAKYLGGLLTGDLGRSYQQSQPVSRLLTGQVWPTVQLALAALVLALVFALLGALLSARRGPVGTAAASVVELLAVSTPPFWLGLVLVSVFSFGLGWFPAVGAEGIGGLVLPALALAIPLAGVFAQIIRQELHTVDGKAFVLTARARGLSAIQLQLRHTLRHALLPVVTLSGWVLGNLFGGAVLVENIFARPGLGRVLVEAVSSRDIPVVSALVVLAAAVFVVLNLVVDVLHPIIDPRLRGGGAR